MRGSGPRKNWMSPPITGMPDGITGGKSFGRVSGRTIVTKIATAMENKTVNGKRDAGVKFSKNSRSRRGVAEKLEAIATSSNQRATFRSTLKATTTGASGRLREEWLLARMSEMSECRWMR